jgi:CubicO group peptidase (beta-lactamase class C family)
VLSDGVTTEKRGSLVVLAEAIVLAATALLFEAKPAAPPVEKILWPTKGRATTGPAIVGLDEQVLLKLDNDLASGKYSDKMDSFAVFGCGMKVFERTCPHDYAKIYGNKVGERGPFNERLTGQYNFSDPDWHPCCCGTDLHTMQSVRKTVISVIIGVAMQCGDFKAGLHTPILKYFDLSKVKNVDDRKRRMTLRKLLTMTPGLDWNDRGFFTGDRSSMETSLMGARDDWVQYAIDKPMAAEPGAVWNYNARATMLLAYIF